MSKKTFLFMGGGDLLAGSFDVEFGSMSKRKENIFEDVMDSDIKNIISKIQSK